MATQKIELRGIPSDVGKVLKSNYSHFITLSAIFSGPFLLFIIASPTLQQITNIHTPQFPYNQDSISLKYLIFFVLYTFILLTLYTCATAAITYSSYHVIFGHPVKFMYSIKSISNSFIRLFATFSCALFIIFSGLLAIASIVFGIIRGFEYLGFQSRYSSEFFFVVMIFILGVGLLYACANWVLAPVIVVMEKSWGLEPLRRSTYLVKGSRGAVVRFILWFCLIMYSPLFVIWNSTNLDSVFNRVALILIAPSFMMHPLYSFTANTVLYIKCKAFQGELTGENEIEEKYASLPVDEEEVSHFQPKIYEV